MTSLTPAQRRLMAEATTRAEATFTTALDIYRENTTILGTDEALEALTTVLVAAAVNDDGVPDDTAVLDLASLCAYVISRYSATQDGA